MTTRLAIGLVLASTVIGCEPTYLAPSQTPVDSGTSMPPDFSESARSANVPGEVLYALARAETNFQMVIGEAEFDGQEPAFGLMGLRGEQLQLAADLSGIDVETVKTDRAANIAAAAELLGFYGEEFGLTADSDLGEWAPVVARFANLTDDEATAEYIHHEVYGALRDGIETEGYSLAPMDDIVVAWPEPLIDQQRGRDSGAIWSPSPNYSSRSGYSVNYVIIHTCEGSYSGCWSWLANSASGVSAHYVVNDSGSEVRALVDESNKAWHISANYDCSLNSNKDCSRNGQPMNNQSVGIEHAGYGSQSSWSNGLIQRSAELTCGITQRNGVIRDSYHIVGHGQLQP
ncbi:MAG: N-acetylmuramoyl-L-alanine amidase, partial [Myxococcales bacterium]|nr:N-acetylmuramoyl-L-alanine amidase [Myxococcales bacterium]